VLLLMPEAYSPVTQGAIQTAGDGSKMTLPAENVLHNAQG
jgi:hypothetical protein